MDTSDTMRLPRLMHSILGDRAQFMGGVELAAAVEEVVLAVVAVDVAVADFHAQVVLIAALAVHQRAEQALS